MFLNIQVKHLWGFKFAYVALLLFQSLTIYLICIIVITYVGRNPAAALGNYQMRSVFLPSSCSAVNHFKLPGLTPRRIYKAINFWGPAFLNDTFHWILPGLFFQSKNKGRKSATLYTCWPNIFYSDLMHGSNFFLQFQEFPITGM